MNAGDDERSTLSDSSGFDSLFDSDDDKPKQSFVQKQQLKVKRSKAPRRAPTKQPLFIQRDIAEGRAFNNSFTGPYPEETDHLHHDKGPNPQFAIFRQRVD